jgi:hypothetical protein
LEDVSMKLSALLALLIAIPDHKAAAEAALAALKDVADLEPQDLVTRLTTAEAKAGDLGKQLEVYAQRDRDAVLDAEFAKACEKHGIAPTAVSTARALAKLDGVQIDVAKKSVTGLTKELFDSLKATHPILNAPPAAPEAKPASASAAAAAAPVAAGAAPITPMPPAGTPAPAAQPAVEIPGAAGLFMKAARA